MASQTGAPGKKRGGDLMGKRRIEEAAGALADSLRAAGPVPGQTYRRLIRLLIKNVLQKKD